MKERKTERNTDKERNVKKERIKKKRNLITNDERKRESQKESKETKRK